MKKVLSELDTPDQPVILFANPSVLDFYPRFGFGRLAQTAFIGYIDLLPAGTLAPSLDLARSTDRAWLADHCATVALLSRLERSTRKFREAQPKNASRVNGARPQNACSVDQVPCR
jgi:hypothetical protein